MAKKTTFRLKIPQGKTLSLKVAANQPIKVFMEKLRTKVPVNLEKDSVLDLSGNVQVLDFDGREISSVWNPVISSDNIEPVLYLKDQILDSNRRWDDYHILFNEVLTLHFNYK